MYSRQTTGYLNRESGQNFEEYISLSLRWYEKNGLAVIEKNAGAHASAVPPG